MGTYSAQFALELVHAVETSSVTFISGYPDSNLGITIPFLLFKAGFTDYKTCPKRPPRLCTVHKTEQEALACSSGTRCLVAQVPKTKPLEIVGTYLGPQNSCNEYKKLVHATVDAILKRILVDPLLSEYSILILTSIQERLVANDLLMAILKRILSIRPRLRLVLASHGGDVPAIFSFYRKFKVPDNCELQALSHIRVASPGSYQELFLSNPCCNYLDATVSTVGSICKCEPNGNVLVLVPDYTHGKVLQEYLSRSNDVKITFVLQEPPRVTCGEQNSKTERTAGEQRNTTSGRKVYIWYNLEHSRGLEDIKYLVDPCLVVHANGGITVCTRNEAIARAAICKDPAGTSKCFRLLPESVFSNDGFMIPSRRVKCGVQDLAWAILLIGSLGIDKLSNFDFVSRPSIDQLTKAMHLLYQLQVMDAQGNLIYPIANFMAEVGGSMLTGAFLFKSTETGCSREALIICAMMQVADEIFKGGSTPMHAEQLEAAKLSFAAQQGDLLSYFNVYQLAQFYKDEDPKWLSRLVDLPDTQYPGT
ncbi:bifunctional Helicase-associated domain/P-loop containing nucleoside triphosphate hydrolase [Babesia duncani]|uniref:Bifunctional Helicase-associated domain/P-loop containing nucleoside triphosphate hydrolase n=1 Tax=Babesia duncani TaxID=323732 RepID=A0AAD9PLM6_9APIC|nr:bifunctional Helicase-associated domain/P-loop containing nucleoside triphosphate hydrolase [Babesia duncani]